MTRRTAVLCIYLVTAATSIAAVLLPHVQTTFGAMMIIIQTALVLGVVMLLEQHPLPLGEAEAAQRETVAAKIASGSPPQTQDVEIPSPQDNAEIRA
jgi:hypothetical protein